MLCLRGSVALVMAIASFGTTNMDNQRAGGLGYNNDFISGEGESKDRMSCLLNSEAQIVV